MTGGKLIRPGPAEVEFKNMRFLITDQPHDSTLPKYIAILKEHKVTHLVCATDPTYKTDDLAQSGVTFTELSFSDGSPPSQEIIEKWLSLVKKVIHGLCIRNCIILSSVPKLKTYDRNFLKFVGI